MFSDLKGKRILITGSTEGIGMATAIELARYGAVVGLNSHVDPADPALLLGKLREAGGDGAFFRADITKTAECQRLVSAFVERFDGIDVLINNAGGLAGRSNLENIDDAFYDRVMDLNGRSVLMMTKFAIPHLRASAKASGTTSAVISTGSIAAREGGGIGAGVYAASKAWLHDIHRNWVKEFTKDSIRFNIVAPGTVDTAFHADKSDELKTRIANSIPMGRFGTVQELAPAYVFFASHAASGYITGQILDVNGGQICP
uniref:NADH-dependent reductase for 4-deoxy-L-erythro-5-hexoseulose uronate n=1 Tax=Sphingomonas sp. A1 TaxID=90322 RepID=A0A075B5H4_9SPHN|nr:Chain A, NADH-dependent reductase for 4-deoxy-L-erythro-5-hexoseulose uronate [Sphingomonas sp. A1]4TKL_B Chain B, NADH-dependent reductase for 4-deoxy-L-erythro-5-hexoseulose uronate [Sphingomonas sp. A1]4TKM_A Chain A, NADH-dependent reductase for 4-deoxy-L-erythro-5-hexoseulose uronate [Sphingomonas sp. A1]4TKM_B Chain B, NADH-dependent reductase for 4-deoxy-L-erythro-5-hexoseulose uronate [Sphingomonas sp. A1]BAP40335.1 NADH-dependent reductase for 4-deoxy-L-erythro-5-hexoseulose uronate